MGSSDGEDTKRQGPITSRQRAPPPILVESMLNDNRIIQE